MAISFEQPQSGPGAEQAAFGYGALQTKLATQPQQKDVFAAQVQANRDQLQANLGVNRDVFGAQVSAEQARERANEQVSRDSFAAQTQANRDQFQAQAQAEQSEQRFQQQQQLQESQANLQQQLSEAQLSQGEQLRMQRLDNTSDWLTNESGLQGEDLQDAIMQVRTGLDPLVQRTNRARALTAELGLQQVQQQQGLADAMGIEGEAARAEAFMRRNTFVDPATGTRYGLDRNGSIAGTFDAESGEYVPFGLRSAREASEARAEQRREQQEEKQRIADEKREQKERDDAANVEVTRQNQLAAAAQRTDTSVRHELQQFRREQALNPNTTPPAWIGAELQARTPSGGTTPAFSSLTPEDINNLVGSEVDSRVRNTHGHLIGIDPQGWQQQSDSNPFSLERPTPAASTPAAAVAQVAASVMQGVARPITPERAATLRTQVDAAYEALPWSERYSPTFGVFNSAANILQQMKAVLDHASNRPLNAAEQQQYVTLYRRLQRYPAVGQRTNTAALAPW